MIFDTLSVPWIVFGVLAVAVAYLTVRLINQRLFYHNLPGPPHSLIWGHIKILGEYIRKMPPDSYMQAAVTQMKQDFDLPDLFYLDLWPVGPRFLICSGPDAAAIPTTANVFPQANIVAKFFIGNLGTSFIEATNGTLWKDLHHMLAPGLTPGAVRTYYDIITDEAKIFHDRLKELAKSDKVVDINAEMGKYPFEVVCRVFFGEKVNSQTTDPRLYEDVKTLADLIGFFYISSNPVSRWFAHRKKARIVAQMEEEIDRRVRSRFATLQQMKVLPNRTNATSLVDRMLVAQVENGLPLDHSVMVPILENAKGLLTAGYGTTTDTSSYMYMLLSAFPDVLRKLREEHDRVFDKTFDGTLKLLRENPGMIKDLEYTTAVIQESLRAFPIGLICRDPLPGMETLEYKGRKYPVTGHTFGVSIHAMHYDTKVFKEPKKFDPDRFLGPDPSYPRNGYRPFERGLRSCMGQNLAMDEMRIVLLMTARWFDFELCDHEPVKKPRLSHTDFDTKIGLHAFQGMKFSAGPHGPVKMKVRHIGTA